MLQEDAIFKFLIDGSWTYGAGTKSEAEKFARFHECRFELEEELVGEHCGEHCDFNIADDLQEFE
jgi:hypothetical protein